MSDIRDLLIEHIDIKSKLDHYKKVENDLRIQIVDIAMKEFDAGIGTTNILFDGIRLKVARAYSYTLDASAFSEVADELSDEELACINMKPNLILANFKRLEDSKLLSDCVVVKESMPTIKIELGE